MYPSCYRCLRVSTHRYTACLHDLLLPALETLAPATQGLIVGSAVDNLGSLSRESVGFAYHMASVPCVPNGKGDLCVPTSLYHPKVAVLAKFVDPDTVYPARE